MYATIWSLLPPCLAIALALITKEVYSSLFIGILAGGVMYCGFNLPSIMNHVFVDGMIHSLSNSWNVGILIFLVVLGSMVMLMNRAGGSAAFGKWASEKIKTPMGAQIATVVLGMLICIDDYFICLTLGSVMRPLTDRHKISRAKLAYLIDATAAPICIIAPVSSWAAAVSGFVDNANGFELFIRAIPYNYYAIFTVLMIFIITIWNFDYGPMYHAVNKAKSEYNEPALTGAEDQPTPPISRKGRVVHLVLPIIFLILCCTIGMIYTGGYYEGVSFTEAFAGAKASVALVFGSISALILTIVFYLLTRVLDFRECMNAIPEGFKSMVPALLILTFAWTLKTMTDSLGASEFVAGAIGNFAANSLLMALIPLIVFVIGALLAFAIGTSWGTFGILIPIVVSIFGGDTTNELMIMSISACMAGAVCGDHCSPISDTTIMASAGADCNHMQHVSTQLPYAITVAIASAITYLISGFILNTALSLLVGALITVGILFIIKKNKILIKELS